MSRTPIVRPVSWLNASINVAVLTVFVVAGTLISSSSNGAIAGALTYLVISFSLRRVFARHHRIGISHCKRQQFSEAIKEFHESFEFFQNHKWLDDFRAITMLSASGMCYREMALVSLGFCYGQIGDGLNARKYYEQCLQEFPDNGMAESALRLLNAGSQSARAT